MAFLSQERRELAYTPVMERKELAYTPVKASSFASPQVWKSRPPFPDQVVNTKTQDRVGGVLVMGKGTEEAPEPGQHMGRRVVGT